jgi:hypothetical protein
MGDVLQGFMRESGKVFETLRREFARIARENGLESERVQVVAHPLTPEEAIGRPEDLDYPLLKGKERLMEAKLMGTPGQAFTDMFGEYEGTISDVIRSELRTNFYRAVFISTLNAAMNHVGLIDKVVHCKDQEPKRCSRELLSYIREQFDQPKIAVVGFQPRIVEVLSNLFRLRVTDLDPENIGKEKFGISIEGPERTQANLIWCDVALVTGTTIVNDTIGEFLIQKPTIFYGVTISGAAKILGLHHFCAYGRAR